MSAEDYELMASQLERSLCELLDPLGPDLSHLKTESPDETRDMLEGAQRIAWVANALRHEQRLAERGLLQG